MGKAKPRFQPLKPSLRHRFGFPAWIFRNLLSRRCIERVPLPPLLARVFIFRTSPPMENAPGEEGGYGYCQNFVVFFATERIIAS